MKNELVEKVIINFQKRWGISKEEKNIKPEDRKATVRREGKKITIIPKSNVEYTPNLVINDADVFEKVLERYLDVIKNTDIKSTKIDQRHTERYFLFNVWKNATMSDYLHPEKFINRYTNFIKDDTFQQYDELTPLGYYEGNILLAEREEDDYGFETPYIMHLSFTDGKYIYNLPWIRYGISLNKSGEKIAYIYALQKMEPCSDEEYNEKRRKQSNAIQKFLNSIVRIYYVSSSKFDSVMIKLPSFAQNDNNNLGNCDLKISEEMYEGIKVILEQLKKAQIPCDSINVDGQEFFESYGQIDEYLDTLIDLNIIFPFKENIIVNQQIEQKKDEEIR